MKILCQKNIRITSYLVFSHFIVPKQYSHILIVSGDRNFLNDVWGTVINMFKYIDTLTEIKVSGNTIEDAANYNTISKCLATKDNYEEIAGFCGRDLFIVCDEPTTPFEHLQVLEGYGSTDRLFYVQIK